MPKGLVFIDFTLYEGTLDIYDVCTFINMLNSTKGGENVIRFLEMGLSTLKSEIVKFARAGF